MQIRLPLKPHTPAIEEPIPEELAGVFETTEEEAPEAPEATETTEATEATEAILSGYDRCLSPDELLACRKQYAEQYDNVWLCKNTGGDLWNN